jgi:hypothetical protein
MGDCINPAEISDFATKDTNRVQGNIAKALAANSPFLNVLKGGTFASGVSDEVRSVVQLPAAPGDSLVNPSFTNDTEICGTSGTEDRVSTAEFTYRLKSKRGRGPRVCVKQGYAAFKNSYSMAEDSLAKTVTQYLNADIKYQLYSQSASKFNASAGYRFNDMFTGGDAADIGVKFADVVPTGEVSFKAVHKVARHLREHLLAESFSGGNVGEHFKVIGGIDIIDKFREETGVKDVLLALTNGGYKLGESVLTSYKWDVSAPYRGLSFGVDQRPMRATGFNPDGTLALVNPVVVVDDDEDANKAHSKPNPAWLDAPLEILFLIADNTFERQVPERYVGEGSFKFAPQLHMGELQWHYVVDNDCNPFGDFGWHQFQISRAYRPIRPEHVIPILFKRCDADLGLFDCDDTGTTYTGSVL